MSHAPGSLRLTLSPRLSELTRIRNELDRYLRDGSLPETVRSTLLVVTEEILINIVRYGCSEEASDTIEVRVEQENSVIHMEFIDSGKPFNPLKEAGRETAGQLVDKKEPGGFGVHLVRELTNHQEYTRKADRNHFRITKHVLPPS
jgi:serine/threonine-protein kinase RsbW